MFSIRRSLFVANGARRAFSQSACHRRGTLPVYLESSSPELSQTLATLNSKVLLPQHLTSEQKKLVYRQENRAKLESEPVEITLGDVTLPLEHIDRNKDQPRHTTIWKEVFSASQTPEDWENAVRAMEGFHNAGLRRTTPQLEMAVRRLEDADMHHLILKAVQRPDATGLRLRERSLVMKVMRAMRSKAWKADLDKEELKKALSMSEQIVELMDSDAHAGKLLPENDPRTLPQVIAVPLELAAELAYRHEGDVEKVKKYAARLMNALKQHEFLSAELDQIKTDATKTEADFPKAYAQAAAVTALSNSLLELVPVWNGLSTARTVLDDKMPMDQEAERVQRQIREVLGQAVSGLERLSSKLSHQPNGWLVGVKNAIQECEEE